MFEITTIKTFGEKGVDSDAKQKYMWRYSLDTGTSRLFKNFVEEIQYKNRNPQNARVLELLKDEKTNTIIKLNKGEKLYRSRVIKSCKDIGKYASEGFFGYDAAGSFVAPKEYTKDMRANYKYIPYLYTTSSPLVSIYEVRPRYGAKVSIATIKVNEDLKILDFTMKYGKTSMNEAKINLFAAISECFSKPVTDEDDTLDYIPTQYISEYAKNLGYDGIAFVSSVFPKVDFDDLGGINFVIFNFDKTEVIKSNVVSINQIGYDAVQVDSDTENILNAIEVLSE